ncbi:ATP-binding protein [Opitutus sp. ER46]|uniref:ATP-binding protein n=1 Tax=Opitutus sp. ER46 TaxID=2161864 RepID=UPI000D31BB22|nr:ATP-binding protein [Opitutus sp. ER46]PTX99081.1 hypothetical protein DB354_03450 [Opitutus sp. ER46]
MTSIRRRLALALCLGLGVLLLLGLGGLYWGLRGALVHQLDETLLAIAHDLEADLRRGETPMIDSAPPHSRDPRRGQRYFFQIADHEGKVLHAQGLADTAYFSPRPERRGGPVFGDIVLPQGEPGRALLLMAKSVSTAGGPLRIVVATDREALAHVLGTLVVGISVLGVALIAAIVAFVLWALRRELRPIDRLAGEAAAIDARSLDRRFRLDGLPAELRPIALRLNDLLARLEESFARERRVSSDLAHELRTPLAELRVLAESALKWPDTRDPESDRDVLAIATHMDALLSRMLLIARSEEGRIALTLETVAVDALVREVWSRLEERAQARGIVPSVAWTPLPASADRVLLRSVITNLLENAVDYTAQGGALTIAFQVENPATAVVVITNAVADLSPDEVPRMFERYWRKDAARGSGAHFGLGLALTQRFCVAMGWSIQAEMPQPGLLAMRVRGPLAAPGR